MLQPFYVKVSNVREGQKQTWKREDRIRQRGTGRRKDGRWGGENGKGKRKREGSWEEQGEAITQREDRCDMPEKKKWKAHDQEMETG